MCNSSGANKCYGMANACIDVYSSITITASYVVFKGERWYTLFAHAWRDKESMAARYYLQAQKTACTFTIVAIMNTQVMATNGDSSSNLLNL